MAVGEEGTYLTSLTFDSYSVNTGGGYKASFVFEGFDGDMTGCFTASSTWPVNASSTTGPKCKVLDENSAVVAGLTGKTITSDTIAPSQYQGTLDIYPLSAGAYTIEYYDDTSTLVGSESFVVANTNPKMKDLASGVLVNSVSASATSLVVNVGSGTDAEIKGVWPDTPFYITAMPANPSAGVPNSLDSEIMKVSAVGTDGSGNTTLSVARAQRGSTAQAFSAGAVITNASYADDAVVLGEETSPENPSPWIETGDIKDNQITSAKIADSNITTGKIADGAVTEAKIDWTTFETGWIELSQTYGVKYKRVGKTVTLAMLNPSNITLTGYVERLLVAATDGAIIAPSIELRFPVYGRNNAAIYGLITTAGKISLFNWGTEQAFEPGGLTFTVTFNID